MAPLKLTYFDFRARAEVARLLLHYGGVQFEDVRISNDDWPKLKPSTPFGQIPILEVDGKIYAQSTAICRYAANLVKLAGNSGVENLEIDGVVDLINEVEEKLIEVVWVEKNEERKKELMEKLKKEILPVALGKLDKLAQQNGGYLVLKRLTWADVRFLSFYEGLLNLVSLDVAKPYQNLQKVIKNVLNNPNIKKYVQERPAVSMFKYDIKSEI